jgi:hypothetical protein
MLEQIESGTSRWCIVVADDDRPDRASGLERDSMQYCRLSAGATLLQRALRRAAAIAPRSQMLIAAFESRRDLWEPSTWFVKPGSSA